ncbi:hypothetical protein TGVAND_306035 [Toxoplasma gondii VAND]|uniref:Uncharacterized protein n=1 Tax=Toxoplasma gondii VAND TaxID=933077 RepID=A0A086PQR5_TOXGO|nr:hypothetical protein TGVAND_306035 [Toxoplasma gondii VAND]
MWLTTNWSGDRHNISKEKRGEKTGHDAELIFSPNSECLFGSHFPSNGRDLLYFQGQLVNSLRSILRTQHSKRFRQRGQNCGETRENSTKQRSRPLPLCPAVATPQCIYSTHSGGNVQMSLCFGSVADY